MIKKSLKSLEKRKTMDPPSSKLKSAMLATDQFKDSSERRAETSPQEISLLISHSHQTRTLLVSTKAYPTLLGLDQFRELLNHLFSELESTFKESNKELLETAGCLLLSLLLLRTRNTSHKSSMA